MKLKKRIVGLILTLTMSFSMAIPAFATENTPLEASFDVIESATDENNIVTYEVSESVGAYYYFEMDEQYTMSFSLAPDMTCAYSVKFNASDQIFCGEMQFTEYTINDYDTVFKLVRSGIINSDNMENFAGVTNIFSLSDFTNSDEAIPMQNSISSSDQSKIDKELRSAGYPAPYNLKFLASGGNAAHRCELYETLMYLYTDIQKDIRIEAYTLASIVSTILSIPESALAKVLTLALNGAGLWVTAVTSSASQYAVTALFSKYAYIDGSVSKAAARQVNWTATVGDVGAALTAKSENIHPDYNLNNGAFILKALDEYGK